MILLPLLLTLLLQILLLLLLNNHSTQRELKSLRPVTSDFFYCFAENDG